MVLRKKLVVGIVGDFALQRGKNIKILFQNVYTLFILYQARVSIKLKKKKVLI